MKNYLSSAFQENDRLIVSNKIRLVTFADRWTNIRLKTWLANSDEIELLDRIETVEIQQLKNYHFDVVLVKINYGDPHRLAFVENFLDWYDRLLILGAENDDDLIQFALSKKISGFLYHQSKAVVVNAIKTIALGDCYIQRQVLKKIEAPSGQGRSTRAEGRRLLWKRDSDPHSSPTSKLDAVLLNSDPESSLLPSASCPLPSEQSEVEIPNSSNSKLLEWSDLMSIDLLSRWLNIPIKPIPISEICLEIGLLETEKSIFNELLHLHTQPSLYEQLLEHLSHLKEVAKQTDSEFKIAIICKRINDWFFLIFHHQIRAKIKELKIRKIQKIEEFVLPISSGGTQVLLNYYRALLKQIIQIRDNYSLNEQENLLIKESSSNAYYLLKGDGIQSIEALCLSYRKQFEAQFCRATVDVIEEIIQWIESYIIQLSLTNKLISNAQKIIVGKKSYCLQEQLLLKDYLNKFKSSQELLTSFEEQLGVPLNAWGQYISLDEFYNSLKNFIFPMVEELYQQGIKQAFLN